LPRSARISAQTVASLKPGELLWDSELSRFGARRRNSSTTYVLKVRIAGRQRWITLGKHGPLTSAEARTRARVALAKIDCGHDPAREREARKRMPTVAEFADRWLKEHVDLKRKQNTVVSYRYLVERHIKPSLGTLLVSQVKHGDVARMHSDLAAYRYAANRATAVFILDHEPRRAMRVEAARQQSLPRARTVP
jgi:hypothetical protein